MDRSKVRLFYWSIKVEKFAYVVAWICIASAILGAGFDLYSCEVPRGVWSLFSGLVYVFVILAYKMKRSKLYLPFLIMKTIDIALMTSIWSFFLFAGILLPPWYLEYWKKDLEHAGKYLALDHLKTYVKKFTAVYSIIGFLYISIVLAIFRLVYVTYRSSKKETQKLPSREPSLIPLRTQHVQYSTLNTLNVSRHSSIYSCNLSI